jgi:formylglycine-generating enzyme required for sulfatase activity
LLAFAAFIVALLAWLAPFSPIGPSPFDRNGHELTAVPGASRTESAPGNFVDVTAEPTTQAQILEIVVADRGGVAVEQVYVPSGSFIMVSENEGAVHEVTLDAFLIDRMEVTNEQYAACVAAGACQPPGSYSSYTRNSYYDNPEYPAHPVINISWEDACDFAEWAGGRLPTEAEWEYAARGPENRIYPWGSEAPTCDLLNFNICIGDTTEVGSYPKGASWVGALDMAGNVWELVLDWYEVDYYARSPATNPTGPKTGEYKVVRGGGWEDDSRLTHATYRGYYQDHPGLVYHSIGFRVVEPLSNPDS